MAKLTYAQDKAKTLDDFRRSSEGEWPGGYLSFSGRRKIGSFFAGMHSMSSDLEKALERLICMQKLVTICCKKIDDPKVFLEASASDP